MVGTDSHTVLCAGVDPGDLPDTPVLDRDGHSLKVVPSGRALLGALRQGDARLVLLGQALPDLTAVETLQRIRRTEQMRRVSVIVVLPQGDSETAGRLLGAGANAVLGTPAEHARFETWVTRLLSVPRRVDVRVAVQAQVVASSRGHSGLHFFGLSRNLSENGMLLASPIRLPIEDGADVDLDLSLGSSLPRVRVLGRIVREAPEVHWPYVGYGVEFIFVPPESQSTLAEFLASGVGAAQPASAPRIERTRRRDGWVYEILTPMPGPAGWQVEIRRGPEATWRPGTGGPFYVVEGESRERALQAARLFVDKQG